MSKTDETDYIEGTESPRIARLLFWLGRRGWRFPYKLLSIVMGVSLPIRDYGSTRMPHPIGIVLHRMTTLGERVVIMQNVTIAGHPRARRGATIGDDVLINAGAVIVGPVTIGAKAVIGANAVVTRDVSPGQIVGGVPARPLVSSRKFGEGEG